MAFSTRVALVTGANQGIGFEIVRHLCRQFDGKVLLAARNRERGQEAVWQLQGEGLNPEFLSLDVDSKESIRAATEEVQRKYGRLDILINNAGVLFYSRIYRQVFLWQPQDGLTLAEDARMSIRTNYHGVLDVTNAFLPLLQPNSRIVHVSSDMGSLTYVSKTLQDQIMSPDLTVEGLSDIMDQFVKDAQSPDYESKGWPPADGGEEYITSPYCVSKIGVNRLAQLQAKALASDPSRPGILVNAICPGWVRTSMGGADAPRSAEQGADTPVYLALLPPGTTEPNGEFLRDRQLISWGQPV